MFSSLSSTPIEQSLSASNLKPSITRKSPTRHPSSSMLRDCISDVQFAALGPLHHDTTPSAEYMLREGLLCHLFLDSASDQRSRSYADEPIDFVYDRHCLGDEMTWPVLEPEESTMMQNDWKPPCQQSCLVPGTNFGALWQPRIHSGLDNAVNTTAHCYIAPLTTDWDLGMFPDQTHLVATQLPEDDIPTTWPDQLRCKIYEPHDAESTRRVSANGASVPLPSVKTNESRNHQPLSRPLRTLRPFTPNVPPHQDHESPVRFINRSIPQPDPLAHNAPHSQTPSTPPTRPSKKVLIADSDQYTPTITRGKGVDREGYCDLCMPGRWLKMKTSQYWYHRTYKHGISAATGRAFQGPLEIRDARRVHEHRPGSPCEGVWNVKESAAGKEVGKGHGSGTGTGKEHHGRDGVREREGLCGSCRAWVPFAGRQPGSKWVGHAYKCQKANAEPGTPTRRKRSGGGGGVVSPASRRRLDERNVEERVVMTEESNGDVSRAR